MGVSYNRLWKMLIDKNMKRIEMQYLTGISGEIICVENRVIVNPTTTQNIVDHKIEVLIASLSRSNFLAP